MGKKVQFGLSATASFPGLELAGELTTGTGGATSGQPGGGGTGFEALLANLVAGSANGQTKVKIEELGADGVTPPTQEIIDALAGMAEALVPLANAFDKLQIPNTEQLDKAQAALSKLVESINAHPNRPDLTIKGPIGAFAAQLSQLRQASADAGKEGASDFAKVGKLMERLDNLLTQVAGGAQNEVQQNAAEKTSLNIHQIIDRLNQLAEKLPNLSAQIETKFKEQVPFGNSIVEAQTTKAPQAPLATAQVDHSDVSISQTQKTNAGQEPSNNVRVDIQNLASPKQSFTPSQQTTLPIPSDAESQLAQHQQVADHKRQKNIPAPQANSAPTSTSAGAEPDVLAHLATLGQQQNTDANKSERSLTASAFSDVAADDAPDASPARTTFTQVHREANLHANNAYPEAQKSMLTASATAPLPTDLDAVETGTEKLLGQHKIETFQQQTNLIDAAKSQTSGRPINIPGVAFEIVRQFRAGMQRFEVRLDPPEMGRIDVRMEVEGNNVTARMVVERAETLDLLQRDARVLERALQQAGLNAERANLQFSLKQDGQGSNPNFTNQNRDQDPTQTANLNATSDEQAPRLSDTAIYRGTTGPGGLNLWV